MISIPPWDVLSESPWLERQKHPPYYPSGPVRPSDEESLKLAEDALRRIAERSPVSVKEWARQLSRDLVDAGELEYEAQEMSHDDPYKHTIARLDRECAVIPQMKRDIERLNSAIALLEGVSTSQSETILALRRKIEALEAQAAHRVEMADVEGAAV